MKTQKIHLKKQIVMDNKIIKYMLVLVISLISSIVIAQRNVYSLSDFMAQSEHEAGAYYKDTDNVLDGYVGTWEYLQANKVFRVFIYKEVDVNYYNFNTASNFKIDKLVGNYIYLENGIEIINTTNNLLTAGSPLTSNHIYMTAIKPDGTIGFLFKDPQLSKWTSYSLRVSEVPDNTSLTPTALNWKITVSGFQNKNQDVNASQAIRVPNNIVLQKI